jgi:DNA-binding response OmpR family regulator
VRAHLRRAAAAEPAAGGVVRETLRANGVTVDLAARRAWRGDEELELRPKELDLLALLVAEAGRAVTRDRIMREVWDTEWMGSTKTLDTHVLALRHKVGAGAITTLRGVGYRFEDGA